MKRRVALISKTRLKVYKRLRKQSTKAKARAAERRKAKAELPPARCAFPGCPNLATDWHHIKKLGRGGSDRPQNRAMVCRPCHCWLEAHDEAAKALGLSLNSWDTEPSN